MSPLAIGLSGFLATIVLIVLRVPVGIAMAVTGIVGLFAIGGEATFVYLVGTLPYESSVSYTLSVVPLFIAMGVFAGRAGLTRQLYALANSCLGGFRGGLAVATIGACAGFGAICGSAVATTATMARVAIPEMLRHGFDRRLAAATVAAGGTLGILIPPSIILIIYALLTEQSVGRLFVGAMIPGALGAVLYMTAIAITVRLRPDFAPESSRASWGERGRSTVAALPVLFMFTVVIGGIYGGVFTPNEAAAVGAILALGFCLATSPGRRAFGGGFGETALTCASIFLILISAGLFNAFLELSEMPRVIVGSIEEMNLSPAIFLIVLSVFYVLMGMFMDELAVILLTLPVVFPLTQHMGLDPIWFGVYVVTIVEIGLITPPVGLNLFVVKGVTGMTLSEIATGAVPFVLANLVRVALLVLFPGLVTWLPGMM